MSDKMKINIGIDLGTTFSACAYINENLRPDIIKDESAGGKELLPSVVLYDSPDNVLVGYLALTEAEIKPEKTVQFAKNYIGETDFPRPAGVPENVTPVTVSSIILRAIKQYVEDQQYEIDTVVVTVPAYFNTNKTNLTKEAAKLANLTSEDKIHIITEPVAAALYYSLNKRPRNETFLVYDLGGGTFDVVIIKVDTDDEGHKKFRVLAQNGDHRLGGRNWDAKVMEYLFNEARKNPDIKDTTLTYESLAPKYRQSLWTVAENAKIRLSRIESTTVYVKLFDKDENDVDENNQPKQKEKSIPVTLTRDMFNEITANLLEKTSNLLENVLKEIDMSYSDIDNVILVGGSSLMLQVRTLVKEKFGNDKVVTDNSPNFAVAYGAAIFANDIYKWAEFTAEVAENAQNPENTSTDETTTQPIGAPLLPELFLKLPLSIGAVCQIGGDPDRERAYIENILFKDQEYNAMEGITGSKEFKAATNGQIRALFYENAKIGVIDKTKRWTSVEEIFTENQDTLIVGKFTEDHTEFIPNDEDEILSKLGELVLSDPNIKVGDILRINIFINGDGSGATITAINSDGTDGETATVQFQNAFSMTEEEHEQAKIDINHPTIGT